MLQIGIFVPLLLMSLRDPAGNSARISAARRTLCALWDRCTCKREIVFPFAAQIDISLKSSIDPAAAGLEAHFTKWEGKRFPQLNAREMENPATEQVLKKGPE